MSARTVDALNVLPHCLLVAEIGNNHQGDPELARRCIEEAAKAGADMVKFQKRHMPGLFTPQRLAMPYGGRNSFGGTYGEHREALELPLAVMADLKEYAESFGVEFFASVWDERSLEDMVSIGVRRLKLPSADMTNLPLLRKCAATRLPLILSTGMSTLEDIDIAVATVREAHDDLTLLHCNSTYPCPVENIGLPVMTMLARRYRLPVGYSGHETGFAPSVAAVSLGARMVERHFTLDKHLPGTDQACSLTPSEFARLSVMVREVEAALRVQSKTVFPEELMSASKLRKHLVASGPLLAGHCLQACDVTFVCTEEAHALSSLRHVEGRSLRHAVPAGRPLRAQDFEDASVRLPSEEGACAS